MTFTELHSATDALFEPLYGLYESAFPLAERRDKQALAEKIATEPRFHCTALVRQAEFSGLFTYWTFGSFVYVEHFAVNEQLRGHNIGGQVLAQFIQQSTLPVVLEVEPPETPIARRRIAFYERHGLRIVRTDYVQPPYRPGGESLPLYLMSTAPTMADEQIATLKQSVYGV